MERIKRLEELENSLRIALNTINELKKEQEATELAKIDNTLKAFKQTIEKLTDAIM